MRASYSLYPPSTNASINYATCPINHTPSNQPTATPTHPGYYWILDLKRDATQSQRPGSNSSKSKAGPVRYGAGSLHNSPIQPTHSKSCHAPVRYAHNGPTLHFEDFEPGFGNILSGGRAPPPYFKTSSLLP